MKNQFRMASCQDTNMCYFYAPTPPPTPTEKIMTDKRHFHRIKSSASCNIKNTTALDILRNEHVHSAQLHETAFPEIKTSAPMKPPKISLYIPQTPDSKYISTNNNKQNKNTLFTDDDGEYDDESSQSQQDIFSPSSMCMTLYPHESETIQKGVHYTKASGTPIQQLEGSPSGSYDNVQTVTLFTNKFPKTEYLSIINDIDHENEDINNINNNNQQPITPMTPIDICGTPETMLSSITSFPQTMGFERKPPPINQIYNKYNPFCKRDSFEKRKSVFKGTNWD